MREDVPQVIRFEIYSEDPARALKFYARVFACGEAEQWRIPGVGEVTCGLDGEGRLYGLLREWESRRERESREDVRAARCAAARA
ncbi:MAG: hypothetical protein KF868_10630 [Acidobacteria bacterium]|nr:hypothetical protein [Acidobacteriota bacterium]